MTDALFGADFHGNEQALENFIDLAIKRGIDTVLIGGDITPKRIAIKLKDVYPDEDEIPKDMSDLSEEELAKFFSEKKIPGMVLPTEQLVPNGPARTYTQALRELEHFNTTTRTFPGGPLVRSLERQGYMIHEVEGSYYNFESMVQEQELIDRLHEFFSLSEVLKNFQPFPLSDMDREWLGDFECKFKTADKNVSQESKTIRAEQLNVLLRAIHGHTREYDYSQLSLARTLLTYFTLRDKIPELQAQRDRIVQILGIHPGVDEEVQRAMTTALDRAVASAELARDIVPLYGPEHLRILTVDPIIEQLIKEASKRENVVEGQKLYLEMHYAEQLERFKKARPRGRVYTILGNDDHKECATVMRTLEKEGLHTYLENTAAKLSDGLWIVGLPYVPSSHGRFMADWELSDEEFTELLQHWTLPDPKSTVYMMHCPPYGGMLDNAHRKGGRSEHIGWKPLEDWIAQHQPRAVLSGHVHENHLHTGTIVEQRGSTVCYNPGGIHSDGNNPEQLCAVIFNLEHPQMHERITRGEHQGGETP